MSVAGLLTNIIPSGSYERVQKNERMIINPDFFQYIEEEGYPFWRWVTAPVEVLWSDDATIVIAIILFLLVIGGSFSILNHSNLLIYIIGKIVKYFGNH